MPLDIDPPDAACTGPSATIGHAHSGGFVMGGKDDIIVAALAPRITAKAE